MNGASVKKVILMFFSGNDPICHSQKFQPWQTPPSHFLPISPRFLTNIRCRYFSLNIWVVYDQLELDWCIFDQNWAKTRPLHFQIFQILNATDRPIVQWREATSPPLWLVWLLLGHHSIDKRADVNALIKSLKNQITAVFGLALLGSVQNLFEI